MKRQEDQSTTLITYLRFLMIAAICFLSATVLCTFFTTMLHLIVLSLPGT
jgi:hypothetical protein